MRFLIAVLLSCMSLAAQTDYPMMIVPQPIFGPFSGAINATEPLNASATTGVGLMAQVYGASCQIDDVFVAIDTVTSAQSLTVRIEDLDAGGQGDGVTDASCAIATPVTGVNTCNFVTPATKTQGTNFAVYVDWTSTTGDILVRTMPWGSDVFNTRYGFTQTGGKNRSEAPAIALQCSGGRFLPAIPGTSFQVDYQEKGFDSDDTDIDELAQVITVGGADLTAVGICFMGDLAADVEMDITNAAGTSQCTGGDCGTIAAGHGGTSSFELNHCYPLNESVTLSASTNYYISLRTTTITADAAKIITFTPGNARLRAMSGGGPLAVTGAASRVDEGSWVTGASALWTGGPNAEDVYPAIFLVIGGVEDPGAGAATVSYGSVQ